MKQKIRNFFYCILVVFTAGACAKDNAGHYTYVGPSVGANVGYNGVSVGVALYGPNPSAANITVTSGSPTPTPVSASK